MPVKTIIGFVSVIVAMIAALLVGETSVSRQARADRVTVIYWEKWTGDEGEQMRKIVTAFNESQDKVFVQYLSISGVDQKTMLATAGNNPPDVAGIWQDQICQFSDAGALTDMTDMARDNGLGADHYIKGYWEPLNYRGGLWAFPSTPASIGLHVRPDLVPKEFSTPETFPKTIEGLDAVSKAVSKKDGQGNLVLAGFLPSNPGWWNWAWGMYFGGKLIDGDKITVNSPENIRAFEWCQSYAKTFGSKEMTSFQGGFGNFSSPQDAFMTGKVATEINGVWKGNYIKVQKPDTPWFAVPFPYPADRPDLAGHANLSQDVLTIPRGAKHPKEAFAFIAYVQRQDVMERLCKSHGKNSPLAKVSEEFLNTHPNKYIRVFDQLARSPKAFNPPSIGIYPQINSELTVAFQEVNTLQKTPKQALDDAQARLDKLWQTYKDQVLSK